MALLLASSGAVALPACGGNVVVDSGSTTAAGGGGGSTSTTSVTTTTTITTTTITTTLPLECPNGGSPSEECQEPGPNGCFPASAVEDGCCNPATFGPFLNDGLCCYGFCEDACCGRPFVVAGRARIAGVTYREDWCADAPLAGTAALDAHTRAALVEAWMADAQMEHASIASFARFTLELLAAGAPADLVAASQCASLDEIEHARACFGIASRLGARAMGPSALDVTGALRTGSLASSAASAVREGCIGETIAALTARAQLAHAEDDGVRGALARIADDEEAHAELAWRFVAWAISTGGAPVRAAVARAFEEGVRVVRAGRAAPDAEGVAEDAWHRFGRLTADEADRVTASALDEVIVPCGAMLRADPSVEAFSALAEAQS